MGSKVPVDGRHHRLTFLCAGPTGRGEEVGSVLLELTVVEVAERYGVSRQAVHGWLRRYAAGGLEALANRSYRPHRCPLQIPAEVEAHLCELRRRRSRLGPTWAR
jgi:transposase